MLALYLVLFQCLKKISHGLRRIFSRGEDTAARHEHVCTRVPHEGDVFRSDASIHLDLDGKFLFGDVFAEEGDLAELMRHEGLSSKARLDRHHQRKDLESRMKSSNLLSRVKKD